jgi:hypothetical protein
VQSEEDEIITFISMANQVKSIQRQFTNDYTAQVGQEVLYVQSWSQLINFLQRDAASPTKVPYLSIVV